MTRIKIQKTHPDGSYTWVSGHVYSPADETAPGPMGGRQTNVWRTYVDRYNFKRTVAEHLIQEHTER